MNWFDGEGNFDFNCGIERHEWPGCAQKDDLCPLCGRPEKMPSKPRTVQKCQCNEDKIDG